MFFLKTFQVCSDLCHSTVKVITLRINDDTHTHTNTHTQAKHKKKYSREKRWFSDWNTYTTIIVFCLAWCFSISHNFKSLTHAHAHQPTDKHMWLCRMEKFNVQILRVVPFHFYLLGGFSSSVSSTVSCYCYDYCYFLSLVRWDLRHIMRSESWICVCVCLSIGAQCHKIRQYMYCAEPFKVETIIVFKRNVATTVFPVPHFVSLSLSFSLTLYVWVFALAFPYISV